MGSVVSAKAADERAALKEQKKQERKERRRQRRLLQHEQKFDEFGNPLQYDDKGNQCYYDNKGNQFYLEDSDLLFYFDDNGAPFYLDENDQPYYLNENRQIFYLNEKREPYYLDENREKFYLDENWEPYYMDQKGNRYFLDTDGQKYYFDEDGKPYLDDEESNARGDATLHDKNKERQVSKSSFPLSNRPSRSSVTLPSTKESKRTQEVNNHHKNSVASTKLKLPKTAASNLSDTVSDLSSYKSLSFTHSEYEQVIPITPDYIKDESLESETRITTQIEAENKILKKLLEKDKDNRHLPKPKSFHKVGNFNIKAGDDVKDCCVRGQGFLPDGNLIIADSGNCKLKLFDLELELLTSYKVEFSTNSLCTGSNDNTVHVTFRTRMYNGISIFEVNGKSVSPKQTVRMQGVPHGIARSNNGLAVMVSNVNEWQIKLMTLKAHTSRVIDLDNSLNLINPEYLAITKELKLFVSDTGSNSVYCFDTEGEELFNYQQLRGPTGLCIDNMGSVYITSPGVVHQVSSSGERIKAIMRRETIGFAPMGVCYDTEDNMMILTGKSNQLAAYKLS